ncbi:MAG TPA: 2-amino-4-hydroxy-6-hydroxymethyldihydropteridine diphosphokinase [Gemmatirosa sp.]
MSAVGLVAAYVALGSNLGDRAAHLAAARAALGALPETRIVAASRVEETAPIGPAGQGAYLNQMLHVETALDAAVLLAAGHAAERAAGRTRDSATRWGPRTLDVDLVLFGERSIDAPSLRVPHPELAHRDFWQRELAELGVDWRAVLGAVRDAEPAAAHVGVGA